jgi:hypothetical protein
VVRAEIERIRVQAGASARNDPIQRAGINFLPAEALLARMAQR